MDKLIPLAVAVVTAIAQTITCKNKIIVIGSSYVSNAKVKCTSNAE